VIEKTTNHDVKAVEYVLKELYGRQPELAKVGGQHLLVIRLQKVGGLCIDQSEVCITKQIEE
jgi:hypothetical protein